jgi:biopolymer transport protein ExbD
MLDVVFIMLIFFIVTASFLKESGFEVNKPAVQQQQPTEESQSIVVKIMADGQIFIGPRRVDVRSVRPNIERLRAEKPEAPVVVQAHAEARNELLIKAMDAARLAGAVDVSIAELN